MNKKIVIVDDEPQLVKGLKRTLFDLPLTIYEAHDGEYALALVKKVQPDLLILDVMMPALNGIEVCKTIREEELLNGVTTPLPIIMLSGKHGDVDKFLGEMVGANHYLTKPCNNDTLRAMVMSLLYHE